MPDRTSSVFGNDIDGSIRAKAQRKQAAYIHKFGKGTRDLSPVPLVMSSVPNPLLGLSLGVRDLRLDGSGDAIDDKRGMIIGNIRMGYGHYRIAMAMASVIHARGYIPYWFDLNGYEHTLAGRIVSHLNELYSFGSRLSQKSRLFNKLFWEPLNYEGFKKLSYNASDQKVAQLFAPLFSAFPRDIPMITTHGWPAQGALHAGMSNVVNAVVDNWPMALHLAEGAMHAVQGPSAYLGYRLLREMCDDGKPSRPMPASDISLAGQFVDHEIVSNLESDSGARMRRMESGSTRRVLMSIGGAGAQLAMTLGLVKRILPLIKDGRVALFMNFGDHEPLKTAFDAAMLSFDPGFPSLVTEHVDDWTGTEAFARDALSAHVTGVHSFLDSNKFAAVYCTNLLMRACDVLVTKPSELAYYPVPKLMTRRIGGHERWGAIRAAELGDGSYEMESLESAAQALELMLVENDILRIQNEAILKNATIGLYDGCYRVVDMALQRRRP
ncbi:MAG: hypothetical protein RBT62_00590 [Spirochaetia bacterium]|nr:hypothetical protein [Spirochaetia bacterium]